MGQGEVSFDLSQSQLGQAVLVPLGQAQLVPICLSHWDRLCLSQWLVPASQGTGTTPPKSALDQVLGWFLFKNQRGRNRISEIAHQKSVWNCSKILTKNRIFLTKLTHAWRWPKGREQANRVENKRTKGEGARCDAHRPREHHSNHDTNAWSIKMTMRNSLHHLHLGLSSWVVYFCELSPLGAPRGYVS